MSELVEDIAKAIWDARRAHAANAGIFLEFWGDGTLPKANGILEEARAAMGAMWHPIETAPRDATPILAANSRLPSLPPVAVRWLDEMMNPDTGWCDAATASGEALYYNPNYFDYWMPLPEPPAT